MNGSCDCRPPLQPRQLRIQGASATYTTAHGNARAPTHGARPGIEPASLGFLVTSFHCAMAGTAFVFLSLSFIPAGRSSPCSCHNLYLEVSVHGGQFQLLSLNPSTPDLRSPQARPRAGLWNVGRSRAAPATGRQPGLEHRAGQVRLPCSHRPRLLSPHTPHSPGFPS